MNGPTAVATATQNRVGCNDQVIFDGSNSTSDGLPDPSFAIVSYAWDLDGDGVFETAGVRVTRNIASVNQVVNAVLKVTDAGGRTSTAPASITININNVPPVANAGGPYVTGVVGGVFAPVTLDGRASVDPNVPCGAIVIYKWDTDGDGLYGDDDLNGVRGARPRTGTTTPA